MNKWYNNLKIRSKLLLSFILLILLASGNATYAIITLQNAQAENAAMFENYGNSQGYIGELRADFAELRFIAAKVNLADSAALAREESAKSAQLESDLMAALENFRTTLITDEEKAEYAEIKAEIDFFFPVFHQIMDYAVAGDFDASKATIIDPSVDVRVTSLDNLLKQANTTNNTNAAAATAKQAAIANQTMLSLGITSIAIMVLGIFFALYVANAIGKPLRTVTANALEVAAGNSNIQRLKLNSKDEVGQMADALDSIIDSLRSMLGDTQELVQASLAGQLSKRAEADKHEGGFRMIVQGINDVLDAVLNPIQESISVLNEMNRGNLNILVQGEYQGEHAMIKDSLNDTITTIKAYVDEIRQSLAAMAEGDFSILITAEYRGEFVALKEAINAIADSLSDVMGGINNAADQVAAGTQQVSDGAQATSQGATEQAGSIEELTATITQIAEQTRQNALNATEGSTQSQEIGKLAENGNQLMGELQNSMQEINEASSNISKIIKVIEDIAFKTNILALNAAVEAAHAGVHGKGFAVVAEEVRTLAAQSAEAANEITELIESSVERTQAGTRLADETAEALKRISEGVASTGQTIAQIAEASNEQATGVSQVNKGIEQLSQVVQTNSATAEEAAAASEELSNQAALLKQMVSQFKLKGNNLSGYGLSAALDAPAPVQPLHQEFNEKFNADIADIEDTHGPTIILSDNEFGKY